jgi:hypothetical protein
MFGPMKEAVRGTRYSSDEEVMGVVQNWLKTRPKETFFFSDGIKNLVKSWNRYFEVGFVYIYIYIYSF